MKTLMVNLQFVKLFAEMAWLKEVKNVMMEIKLMEMVAIVNAKFRLDGHAYRMEIQLFVNQYVGMESESVMNLTLVGAMMPTIARTTVVRTAKLKDSTHAQEVLQNVRNYAVMDCLTQKLDKNVTTE